MDGDKDNLFDYNDQSFELENRDSHHSFLEEMDEYLFNRNIFSDIAESGRADLDYPQISAAHDFWIQNFLTECIAVANPHQDIHLLDLEIFRSRLSVGRKVFKDFKSLLNLEVSDGGATAPSCIKALLTILKFADLWDATEFTQNTNGLQTLVKAMTFFHSQNISSPSDPKLAQNLTSERLFYTQTIEDLALSYKCDVSLVQVAGAASGQIISPNLPISDGIRKVLVEVLDSIELVSSSTQTFGPPEEEVFRHFIEVINKKSENKVITKNSETVRIKKIVQDLGTSIELLELIMENLGIKATQSGLRGAVSTSEFNQIEKYFHSLGITKAVANGDVKNPWWSKTKVKVSVLAEFLGMTNAELLELCWANNVRVKTPQSTLVGAFIPILIRKARASGQVQGTIEQITIDQLGLLLRLRPDEVLDLCSRCEIIASDSQSLIPTSLLPKIKSVQKDKLTNQIATSPRSLLSSVKKPVANQLRISKLAKELNQTSTRIKLVCDRENITYSKMGLILESDLLKLTNGLKNLETFELTLIQSPDSPDNTSENQLTVMLTKYDKIDFRLMNLSGYDFHSSKFIECCFIQVNLEGADFKGSEILECDFKRIEGLLTDFSNCTIADSSFDFSDLECTNFENSKLTNVTFKDCNLQEANFVGSQLFNTSIPFIDPS